VLIRRFTVGLIALAAFAAISILLTREEDGPLGSPGKASRRMVDDLYAAGL